MGKEYEVVEVFQCPDCGRPVYIEWSPGETSRKVACTSCYVEGGLDDFHFNAGNIFTATRQSGSEFVQRVIDHDLGRETGPVVVASGIADPGVDKTLHSFDKEVV